jgi:GNAT superfamily N-acetyltransferase
LTLLFVSSIEDESGELVSLPIRTRGGIDMTSVAELRALEEGDLPALLALYEQLELGGDASGAELASTWSHILRQEWLIYLGVFVEQQLAATCHAVVVPNLTHGARPYAIIEAVVTDAQHRRRGHGARAMRALIERCWQAGCYKVSLTSGMQRVQAHAFYEALGFVSSKRAFVLRR